MTRDLTTLSLEQLQALYAETNAQLMEALLMGAVWEELREESIRLTVLAREIHHRKYPFGQGPAETPFRINY